MLALGGNKQLEQIFFLTINHQNFDDEILFVIYKYVVGVGQLLLVDYLI